MLIHSPCPAIFHRTSTYLGSVKCNINNSTLSIINKSTTSSSISIIKNTTTGLIGACSSCRVGLTGFLVAAVVISSAAGGVRAIEAPQDSETLSNIPQTLSGECALPKDCKKARIQRPKSRKAESCTIKCVTTCIRVVKAPLVKALLMSEGTRPLVVFKQGFRSRQYCLVECSDICNLIGDGDDGP
ncbi:hypothetical protein CFP56_008553 [Quercus suber]|uniref:Uncharacterized protein n=1 Tax=Quercus suber TaxID=58331 RepID=A0AAW0L5Q7_QUESU